MLWVRIGFNHTQFSVAYILVSTLLFDIGDRDLPVLTSGNWVIKGWVIKWLVKLRTFFTFFSKSKKRDFLRFFLNGWPRFLEHWLGCLAWYRTPLRRRYELITNRMNWAGANIYCRSRSANLAVVMNEYEQWALSGFLYQFSQYPYITLHS